MIIRDRSFPYPVLSPFRDDVTPSQFELSVGFDADNDNHYLQVTLTHENESLSAMVREKRAYYALHVECRRNFYRRLIQLATNDVRLTLPATEIVGRVELSGFVIASQAEDRYRIKGAHPDYGDRGFAISQGDVLAVSQTKAFDAFVDYDPLASISSILTITKSESEEEGLMHVDTESDRIIVTLSRQDYARYTELKGGPEVGPLLASQVVIPALLEALGRIKGSDESDHEEGMHLRWYRSVVRRLLELGKDIREKNVRPIEAVQLLLNLPMRRSLEDLLRLTGEDEPS